MEAAVSYSTILVMSFQEIIIKCDVSCSFFFVNALYQIEEVSLFFFKLVGFYQKYVLEIL